MPVQQATCKATEMMFLLVDQVLNPWVWRYYIYPWSIHTGKGLRTCVETYNLWMYVGCTFFIVLVTISNIFANFMRLHPLVNENVNLWCSLIRISYWTTTRCHRNCQHNGNGEEGERDGKFWRYSGPCWRMEQISSYLVGHQVQNIIRKDHRV